ncbi:Altered inheritance of mitochondria protein 32 [Choanephora cucurbitarum]|uniref:Altered inheritance of mitochondria protein 32 n=1 Tax=Choanephora cucurbitarum TaxID=101091 RepID=A0A1C7N3Z8_9FUNG|nr:Altered inheritance of mitochondria protein 32 [Choanephora cucurbitarum]
MKKSLSSLAGYGNQDLLPPTEFLANPEDTEDDCSGCADPCTEHKEFPSYLHIEKDFPILGTVKPYGRHILIATGLTDWPKYIDDEPNSLAQALSNVIHQNKSLPWKTLMTNASMTSRFSDQPGGSDILIYPDNILVSNVTHANMNDFYQLFVAAPLSQDQSRPDEDRLGQMKIEPSPYRNLMLLCSHRKRDKRCGVTAPMLAQEIDHVLREKDLSEEDVSVMMVSHIGGHKIAGNVICYINHGTRGIWYGRVKTCHCRSIVEETILKGKILKDLYRGAMDNSFENQKKRSILSW